jgi:hypothetical protein
VAISINSKEDEKFNSDENDIVRWMSSACLRKLNKERDQDTKGKLLMTYKNLLRLSINLNSRSNMASLMYEGENKLKEFLKVTNVVILPIDHDL